jgi:outer membrane protein insertion porin family
MACLFFPLHSFFDVLKKRMNVPSFISAVFFALLFTASLPAFASSFAGLTITSITIQDDRGNPWPDPGHISPLMAVKPGDSFSGAAVREGISTIYLTGGFRDIRVEGFPEDDGVKLVYTLVPVTKVEKIVVRGNSVFSAATIRDVLSGVEGRELREERFPDYRTSILTMYQSEGYYGTLIDFKIEELKEPHRAALFIYITEPKRTIIADVDFAGNTVFTRKQLLRVMKSRPGKPLRTDVLFDEDMAALLDAYTRAGYPAARPGPVDIKFREEKAFIVISGQEGPKVTVGFSGNSAFSDSDLRKQVLIWSEHDVSDALIDSSADKIENRYREEGYDGVKVTVRKTESPVRLDLVFDIQEGARTGVEEIIVKGNAALSTRQIKGRMSLRESGWFSSSPFRRDFLEGDVGYLRERYLEAGFLSVEVREKVDLSDGGTKAMVRIDIKEGPQTRAGVITFEGNPSITDAELLDRLSLKPGQPYNERLVDEDRYRILSVYSEKGYLYTRVETEKKQVEGTVDITYRITEDLPVRIGRIILRGNERTRQDAIMRELLLQPGDLYNYEKILMSQQRIYRLGYFSRARFEPLRPGEKDYVKDMILSVEERPAGSVEVGVGYGDLDRARAFLEVSHRNLWGIAHYAGIRFEKSDILTRSILNYQHPWSFGYDLQGKFALTWSDSKEINTDTRDVYYQTRQTAASYGIEKKSGPMTASLTYAFENVENYNVQPEAVLSEQDVGFVRVSSLSPALVWDLRDDVFNPRKGALFGAVLKQAMHQLGSEADFTKVTLQGSLYIPLGAKVVTGLSGRGGMAWPHYETSEIPIHERFYLGGSTTIRGYNQKMVGSTYSDRPDETPTGGSSMVQFNAELRLMPSEGFGFVLFTDAGNVWVDQHIRLGHMRASYGAGIRYGTPVGPLRIDYGQKIHRRPGESPGELHFNIGHTF